MAKNAAHRAEKSVFRTQNSGFSGGFSGFWNRFLRRKTEERLIDGVPWNYGGPLNPGGVTAESAMRLSPVFACVRLLADTVASLPVKTYTKVGERRVLVDNRPLFDEPSVLGTRYDWLYRLMTSLTLDGNAYGLILARDNLALPSKIEWLPPNQVTIDQSANILAPKYYYDGRLLDPDEFIHIRAYTLPGAAEGLSPIRQFAMLISAGLNALAFGNDWFEAGGVPPGKFKNTEKTVSQIEADVVQARLVNAIKKRKPIVYGSDWDFEAISIRPDEAQFIDSMRLTATQIAAIYGIPPVRVGGETGTTSLTYATVEQTELQFLTSTIRPWLIRLETAFEAVLPPDLFIRFNADAMIRTDIKTRYDVYKTAREIGLQNIDEQRALEDMEPLIDGSGKDYTPLDVIVAEAKAKGAANTGLGGGGGFGAGGGF